MNSYKLFRVLFTLLLTLFVSGLALAQEISTSVDVVSKYIWRGSDAGSNAPAFQPTVKFTYDGFTYGLWASTPISSPSPSPKNEIDFFTSYAFPFADKSSVSIGISDYTFPSSGIKYFNFNNWNNKKRPGAHQIEVNLGYTGTEKLPLYFSANIFVYNVQNNPNYFEAGYTTKYKSTDLSIFAGATTGDSKAFYGATKFGFINLGLKATKTVKVTESFSFPLYSQVIFNQSVEQLFYVVGISL